MITHTAHKPFKCPYCPHRANRSDNLKMHIRTRHFGHIQSPGVDSSNVARPMEGPVTGNELNKEMPTSADKPYDGLNCHGNYS